MVFPWRFFLAPCFLLFFSIFSLKKLFFVCTYLHKPDFRIILCFWTVFFVSELTVFFTFCYNITFVLHRRCVERFSPSIPEVCRPLKTSITHSVSQPKSQLLFYKGDSVAGCDHSLCSEPGAVGRKNFIDITLRTFQSRMACLDVMGLCNIGRVSFWLI